ncbi:carbon-nitrogen hydrolase family protein [Schumannella soli]|uniref:carbon-nitrogen hydrolase family protein n=1 Tax=Schumannella soli TaxID=2590779 RepID=UPI0021078248|nr:carbon-nitrogen hydrolase family protein [Schumannella soli]
MSYRIAGLQHPGVPGSPAENLRVLERAAEQAAADGARLLVTSEMFVTGYNIGERAAEFAARPLEAELAGIAQRTGIALVAGLPLPAPGGVGTTNSLLLIDRDGRRVVRYDKTHLFGELDRAMFVAGDELAEPVDFEGLRLGFLICYDVEFPETVRAAALAGADLVIVPTAQMEPYAFIAEHLLRVRAWENQVHLAYVNHSGAEGELRYVGRSSIVAPSGEVLAAAGPDDAELIIADIDVDAVPRARRDNPYLADRRPRLYAAGGAA